MSSDSKYGLVACSCTLMGLSTIAVGMRFYSRRQQKVPYLADDWIILPALITYIGATITVIIGFENKLLGYSFKDFSPEEQLAAAETSSNIQIALDVLPTTSLACVKLSALFFYRRVFCVGGPRKWFDRMTTATIVIVCIWLVVFQFLTGFQCGTHLSALWDGTYLEYCNLSFPFLYGLTISDFLLDLWILCLPVPLVLRLSATIAKKLSICGIFLLAFVGLGASIGRMVVLIEDELGGPTYYITHDVERTVTSYLFFVMLENGMSLVAVNLPSLWLLCTSVIPERIARSLHALSLSSLHSDRSGNRTAKFATEGADQETFRKPMFGTVDNSSNPSVPSISSRALRSDLEGRSWEARVTYEAGHASGLLKTAIHVQDTVELRRD